jgi:hypothetical protein
MSATSALILLAGAATACGPATHNRLAGEAQVVQAILESEARTLDVSAPTLAGLSGQRIAASEDAESDTAPADDAPPADQCKAQPIAIA